MAKTLSLNEIRQRCVQLVIDWRDEPGEEKQQAQSFVRDLLRAYGIAGNRAALYEKRAKRSSTGRQGYIDALIPGLCLIEMKSKGKDLIEAEAQALDYIDGLETVELPQWVITSDFSRFRVLDLQARIGEEPVEFSLEDLPKKIEDLAFLAGYQRRDYGSDEQETASIKAAKLMAELYEELEGSGYSDHEASVFLIRTLFALYSDDSGVWERNLFHEYLKTRTNDDGSDLGGQLSMLYQALNKKPEQRQKNLDEIIQRFPYVNGGIFAEALNIPAFDARMREKLLAACAFNWSAISPAIFGSLFQAVKDKKARRELGEHYTTETNILKTIGPLFLDELQGRFREKYHDSAALRKLQRDMGELRIADFACGCGNFLIVSYREMRALELDILVRLQELNPKQRQTSLILDESDHVRVRLTNFYGIELEEWPATIARTAMFLVDHQANQAMASKIGSSPDLLPLSESMTVVVGNALQLDWEEILPASPNVRIVGNPPFIGHQTKQAEQRADLQKVWGPKKKLAGLDYVTGWHAKCLEYFKDANSSGEWAFVTTNSIVQGDQVARLFEPIFNDGWKIKFAHRTFPWTSEAPGAAAVHCAIVGFTRTKGTRRLFTYERNDATPIEEPVSNINGNLMAAPNVLIHSRSKPLSSEIATVAFGTMPVDGGNLLINSDEYSTAVNDPIAKKYIRRFVGARELLHGTGRWCLWLEDAEPSDIAKSSFLKERVTASKEWREVQVKTGDAYKYRETPHLFRPNAQRPRSEYVCIPRHVSHNRKYFTVLRYSDDVIAGDANFTMDDPDDLQFGLISSGMFMAWQRAVGGRIKSDLRFAQRMTWYTFPVPSLTEQDRQSIRDAARLVFNARAEFPDRSLADHYSVLSMAPSLLKAHVALDRAVDKAFGANGMVDTDLEREQILLKKYADMTSDEV